MRIRIYAARANKKLKALTWVIALAVLIATPLAPAFSNTASAAPMFTRFTIPTANSNPQGIIKGDDGALWFAEGQSGKIGRMTTAGTFTEYAVPGLTSTSSTKVYDITQGISDTDPTGIGESDGIWFTAPEDQSVGRILPDGTVAVYSNYYPLDYPLYARSIVGGGPQNYVWSAGATRFSASSGLYPHPIGTFVTSGLSMQDITVGPDKTLYATGAGPTGQTTIISYGGGGTAPMDTPAGPMAMAADGLTYGPDNAIWFAAPGTNQIGRFALSRRTTTTFNLPTAGSQPHKITAASDGALWFTENGSNRLGRITTSGAITEYPIPAGAGGTAVATEDITVGPDGALWMTSPSTNEIIRATVPALDTTAPTLGTPTWTTNPKATTATTTLTVPATDDTAVIGGEYFLGDTDPGQGNGATMTLNGGNLSTVFGTDFPTGVYKVSIRAKDAANNWSLPVSDYLVVYDTDGPRMTGRRTITPTLAKGDVLPGLSSSSQTDQATFAFSVRYTNAGAINTNSDLQFTYNTGRFCTIPLLAQNCHKTDLNASSIAWLTTQGTNNSVGIFQGTAQLKINNVTTTVVFRVTGRDGSRLTPTSTDQFELRIFNQNDNPNTATPIYKVNTGNIDSGNIRIQ